MVDDSKTATYHQDNKIELFSHLRSSAKEGTKDLLTLREFTTANKIGTIEGHDTVDDKEAVLVGGKVLGEALKLLSLHLMEFNPGNRKMDGRLTSLF
jgi:hypothetical protein